YTHQVIDLQGIFTPISKGRYKLGPDNVHRMMETALQRVVEGRPGPVHLQISNEDAAQHALDASPLAPGMRPSQETQLAPAKIHEARTHLSGAKRPVVVAGLGLEPEAPYAALRT